MFLAVNLMPRLKQMCTLSNLKLVYEFTARWGNGETRTCDFDLLSCCM